MAVAANNTRDGLLIKPSTSPKLIKEFQQGESRLILGTVVKIIPEKFYGFIQTQGWPKTRVFFHGKNVINPSNSTITIREGDFVKLEINEDQRGEKKHPDACLVILEASENQQEKVTRCETESISEESELEDEQVAIRKKRNIDEISGEGSGLRHGWFSGQIVNCIEYGTVNCEEHFYFIRPDQRLPPQFNAGKDVYARSSLVPKELPPLKLG